MTNVLIYMSNQCKIFKRALKFMNTDSFLSAEDSTLLQPKANPPKPMKESNHVIITPISSSPFPPFSHLFFSITKATNLHSCAQRKIFPRLRINRAINMIDCPEVWCNSTEAVFNAAYALDFSNITNFLLNDSIPVIEFHKKYPKKTEIFGFCLCDLKLQRTVEIGGKSLSIIALNKEYQIFDLGNKNIIGSVFLSIGLGYINHRDIFDPNSPSYCQIPIQQPPQPPKVEPKPKKKAAKPKRNVKAAKRKRYDYYSDYYYSDYDYSDNWEEEAVKNGWIRPGTKVDWKSKAKEEGWAPPQLIAKYSVDTSCDLLVSSLVTKSVQAIDVPALAGELSNVSKINSAGSSPSKPDLEKEEAPLELQKYIDMIEEKHSKPELSFHEEEIYSRVSGNPDGSNLFSTSREEESYEPTKKSSPKIDPQIEKHSDETFSDDDANIDNNSMDLIDKETKKSDASLKLQSSLRKSEEKPAKVDNSVDISLSGSLKPVKDSAKNISSSKPVDEMDTDDVIDEYKKILSLSSDDQDSDKENTTKDNNKKVEEEEEEFDVDSGDAILAMLDKYAEKSSENPVEIESKSILGVEEEPEFSVLSDEEI